MRDIYEDDLIHPPRTDEELRSVLNRSAARGIPGCLGFMDGVHVHWGSCPAQWKHLCRGKCEYPTIGWQCTVNHRRRFISVMSAQMGSVNDKSACKLDPFVRAVRHDPLYKNLSYELYDSTGVLHTEKGAWLNVDGGYLRIPQLLVGDPDCLDEHMNFWTSFLESERKFVECAFGILKSRFRILKLPIRMYSFDQIDDTFYTCCILHNMCIDHDGFDDGWHLGDLVSTDRGDLRYEDGTDGYFSDNENQRMYTYDHLEYDLTPNTDYTSMGTLYATVGSKQDAVDFISKRNRQSQHWLHMYRTRQIDWDA